MSVNRTIETTRNLAVGLGVGLLLASCLYSVDGDPEDAGELGAGTVFLHSTTFTEEGIDPPHDEDEDLDAGGHDFGLFCGALVNCVCDGLDTTQYDQCLDAVAELTESECEGLLQDIYPECLP